MYIYTYIIHTYIYMYSVDMKFTCYEFLQIPVLLLLNANSAFQLCNLERVSSLAWK